jgi:hypothetical protein
MPWTETASPGFELEPSINTTENTARIPANTLVIAAPQGRAESLTALAWQPHWLGRRGKVSMATSWLTWKKRSKAIKFLIMMV